jgi:hypothetical protein
MVVPSWVTDTAPITSVAASASATTITEVAVLGTGDRDELLGRGAQRHVEDDGGAAG